MILTNEDLLALSQLLDARIKSSIQAELQPIKDEIRDMRLHIENVTDKNIALLAKNYVPAAKWYEKAAYKVETMEADIAIMKKVITEHSEKLCASA